MAAIDVGTTSSRVILFNKLGQEVSKHQIEYSTSASKEKYSASGMRRPSQVGSHNDPIFSADGVALKGDAFTEIEEMTDMNHGPTLKFPQPGWVECDPVNILTNVVQCFGQALVLMEQINVTRRENKLAPYKVSAVGITNMRETTIVWSAKTGLPVADFGIVWNDTRTADIVSQMKNSVSAEKQEEYRDITGLPFSTYFSCSKLRWFLDNVPQVKVAYENKDLMFGTVDTWLIYHLTHNHAFVSDVSNASRTGFMNLSTLDYEEELLDFWGVDKTKCHLPKIVSSSEYYGDFHVPKFLQGKVTSKMWQLMTAYFEEGNKIPIQGCLGDQSSSLVGQLAYKTGAAKCTYGTGCFLLYNTGTKKLISHHGALTTLGFWFPNLQGEFSEPHFALEGSVAVAGAVVQWLRDNLRLINKAEDVGPMACRVKDSGGVVFVPAFSGLFAPYWDPEARATIMGMSQYTTANHIARAAVEGVCFQARAILKALASDAFGQGEEDKDFLEDITEEGTYEKSPLSTLAVDGGMSRSDEVMQIQADILGPCVKVRRSPTPEATALGAAIAANMAYADEKDRPLWKNLQDAKKWVFYQGTEKGDTSVESGLAVFKNKTDTDERRTHWKLWEVAIERSKGWIGQVEGDHAAELTEKEVTVEAA